MKRWWSYPIFFVWSFVFMTLLVVTREILGPWLPLSTRLGEVVGALVGPFGASEREDFELLWWASKWFLVTHLTGWSLWRAFRHVFLR
jgi:hypothetical protein